jgi:hypothetical protein
VEKRKSQTLKKIKSLFMIPKESFTLLSHPLSLLFSSLSLSLLFYLPPKQAPHPTQTQKNKEKNKTLCNNKSLEMAT